MARQMETSPSLTVDEHRVGGRAVWFLVVMTLAVALPLALVDVIPLPRWKPAVEVAAVPSPQPAFEDQTPALVVIPPQSSETPDAARLRQVEQRIQKLEPRIKSISEKLDQVIKNESVPRGERNAGRPPE